MCEDESDESEEHTIDFIINSDNTNTSSSNVNNTGTTKCIQKDNLNDNSIVNSQDMQWS